MSRTTLAWLLLLLALLVWSLPPAEGQECPEGFPSGLSCTTGIFVTGTPTEPPTGPPIEPPPIEPPPGLDARERWETICTGPDVVSCRTWDSVEDVYLSSDMRGFEWTGLPSSPNRPATNGKCRWNTPNADVWSSCFPAFREGDCEVRRDLNATVGYAQVAAPYDEAMLRASLRSPCYWPEAPGAVIMTDWADQGSSIQHIGIADWPDRPAIHWLRYEYEIALGASMWRVRKGSSTSKLARVEIAKGDACGTERRLVDERFLAITPDRIEIGYLHYCGGSYSPDEATLTLTPDHAERWYRISREIDGDADRIRTIVTDVASGEAVLDYTESVPVLTPVRLDFARLLLHSTSHQPCQGEECELYTAGHFAVRHVVFEAR